MAGRLVTTAQAAALAGAVTFAGQTVSRFLVADLDDIRRYVSHPGYVLDAEGVRVAKSAIRMAFARQLMGGREFASLRDAAYSYVTEGK